MATVENKIPSITGLVKKTDCNTKITDIENILNNHNHDKYVATSECNTLAANVFNTRLAHIIYLKTFDSKNLNVDKKTYKDLDIYNIGYVTIKRIGYGYDVNSVNPLYLRINNASRYIKEVNKGKYLIFDDTDKNKELLKNMAMFLVEL